MVRCVRQHRRRRLEPRSRLRHASASGVFRRDLLGRRRPAQRRVRHDQHVRRGAPTIELHVRRQVRQQLAVGVVRSDLHRVGDDVLRHRGVQADLAHLAVKHLAGEGVHGERDGLAGMDVADVGLVDGHPDLHPRQVLGDQEQARRVQAGDHGLADVDAAVDDDALDRRLDGAVAEVALRPLNAARAWATAAWADRHVGLGHLVGGLVGRRRSGPAPQRGRASARAPSPAGPGPAWPVTGARWPRRGSVGLGLLERPPRRASRRSAPASCPLPPPSRNRWACRSRPCRRIDLPGHLRADVHDLLRLHRARGADGDQQITALHRHGAKFRGRFTFAVQLRRAQAAEQEPATPSAINVNRRVCRILVSIIHARRDARLRCRCCAGTGSITQPDSRERPGLWESWPPGEAMKSGGPCRQRAVASLPVKVTRRLIISDGLTFRFLIERAHRQCLDDGIKDIGPHAAHELEYHEFIVSLQLDQFLVVADQGMRLLRRDPAHVAAVAEAAGITPVQQAEERRCAIRLTGASVLGELVIIT